ncbi:FAD/NAD(P)-binding protein [Salinisphaera aquimarina]|uniref:FAD/NAD(P)-binding protein n=1 Tax=Salinisphaera aquimarina TaxID=2094031 RepID=A0ABV7ENF6_9GAMM
MLDWLIIGGGPQGRFAARAIAAAAPGADVAVLDTRAPLAAWQRRADACGMTYLRSSGAHHLGQRTDDLRRFAAAHGFDDAHRLGYYRRPSRALFEAHADEALADVPTIHAHASAVEQAPRGWRVHTRAGASHRAARVVFAAGPNRPYRPAWGADAEHVYDPAFSLTASGERVAVIGGGITGAQLALRCHDAGRQVCWVTRNAPRPADFDSDPCYAGRLCLEPFARASRKARSALLAQARMPGTLPPDIFARITTVLASALAAGQIAWRRGEIVSLDDAGLVFSDGRRVEADRLVLATGFDAAPHRDSLLGRTMHGLELGADDAGHLLINEQLEAAPGLHVIGRPASLRLGPMAGNIKGARLAGQRLASFAAVASARYAQRA